MKLDKSMLKAKLLILVNLETKALYLIQVEQKLVMQTNC